MNLMSHRSVEILLGRLMTDEALRRQFREAPMSVLADMQQAGMDLSAVEIVALTLVDAEALAQFARTLDPRLRKAALPVE